MLSIFSRDPGRPSLAYGAAVVASLACVTETSGEVTSMVRPPAPSLEGVLHESATRGGYVPANPADVERAQAVFERLLQGERMPETDAELTSMGFQRRSLTLAESQLTVIIEDPDHRTGKGFFVLADALSAPSDRPLVMLQAPHRFHDHFTGTIAARLFADGLGAGAFQAAAWNTVPRFAQQDGRRMDADLAHIPSTYFNAFTRAFATVHPDSRVVQLHGYDVMRRRPGPARESVAIVSAGVPEPTHHATSVARCLADRLSPELVLLYPNDTRELGATTNQNAAALRETGHDGFVHLELSRSLRLRLLQDPTLRTQVIPCLADIANQRE
jgi:hypothetical protein